MKHPGFALLSTLMQNMKPLHIRTPLIESPSLGARWNKRVFLKLENVQPTGSFKIRGIGLLCQTGQKDGIKYFVSSSGGNAGFAAAYAARALRVPSTVCMPTTTPLEFRRRIEELGAEITVIGDVWDETHEYALALSQRLRALYVSPFDHPLIWKGHSSLVDEIADDFGKPDAVVVSVGGGGLLCGTVEGLERRGWHDVPVAAVETEGTASFAASLREGKLVTLNEIRGIAKSLGAKTVARQTLECAKSHPVSSVVVSDKNAVDACVSFADDHRFLVEPACGASLAVAYGALPVLENAKTVVIVVCGGNGVDLQKIEEWQAQSWQSAQNKSEPDIHRAAHFEITDSPASCGRRSIP
jgi:L-serine/L-threonine ammonia-lyase